MAFPIIYSNFAVLMPPGAFNSIIGNSGLLLQYLQAHACPCNGNSGSPNPNCTACLGRGTYWDPPQGPFIALVTLISWLGRSVDMGETIDPAWGQVDTGHPIITIPYTQQPIWTQTNTNDIFVQTDAIMRYQATLRVGENMTIPAWHILQLSAVTIATSGAVIVEDPTIMQPVNGVAYTVSGGTVTLLPNIEYPDGYPTGTAYTVTYYAPLAWVIQEPFGGRAHVRPFGQGLPYPRRFKTSVLDLWLRDTLGSSTVIGITP